MKYFTLLICALVLSIGLNGCAKNQAKFNKSGRTSKKNPTFAQTLSAELAELAKPPVRTTVEGRQEQLQMGRDNSVVQTMYDAFGNKTESRVFNNDSLLKMVVLQTSADGQKQALIYGQNGEVKTAPQNLLDRILTSVAGEIAKTVEIFEGRRENEMLAKLNAPPMLPTEDFSILNANLPMTEETAPTAVETVSETAEPVEKEALPAVTDEPKTAEPETDALKLRAIIQTPKATRPNPSAKNLTAKME